MKYKSFNYSHSGNLGDEVQTFGAELHLPTIDGHVDRDGLALLDDNDEKFAVIMNGWYSNNPKNCLPAAQCVIPIFWGVHLNKANNTAEYFLSGDRLAYLKYHEPIGCRDKGTLKMVQDAGVEAFYSKCVTHTFARRAISPANGKVFLADVTHIPIADELYQKGIEVTQFEKDFYGEDIRRAKAQKHLDMYREEASLVITSKIHCAMPCAAMGIPVIYFGNPDEYRVQLLKDMGITIYKKPPVFIQNMYKAFRKKRIGSVIRKIYVAIFYSNLDWSPEAVEYEEEKKRLVSKLREHMDFCIKRATERG